jgi:hypothetical protein
MCCQTLFGHWALPTLLVWSDLPFRIVAQFIPNASFDFLKSSSGSAAFDRLHLIC